MFIATINRTLESYIKPIVGAEYILRWLPIGTHDWQKFFKPSEIEKKINELNLVKRELNGLKFNIFNNKWNLSKDCSVNYIMVFQKINFLPYSPMVFPLPLYLLFSSWVSSGVARPYIFLFFFCHNIHF